MKSYLITWLVIFYIFSFSPSLVFAKSTYVLPYPGVMPGNKLYKLSQLQEYLQRFWYFGSFASFDYNSKYADKYLIEAKTLFEYDQYSLGYQALLKSNAYFQKIPHTLEGALKENKDITVQKTLFQSESVKQDEVLHLILTTTPETVNWAPEKATPVIIPLHKSVKDSILIREAYE